jgi:hypothetical protein
MLPAYQTTTITITIIVKLSRNSKVETSNCPQPVLPDTSPKPAIPLSLAELAHAQSTKCHH